MCAPGYTARRRPGAVRELIETLLKAKNRWDDLIRRYLEQ